MDDRQLAVGLRFIRDHAFDPITINEVAKVTGMCRRVFERRFAAQMGRSPKAEVLRLRLERVKQLLTDTDWNLAQIAERTGFNYAEYLHTVFTQKTGITPGEFRKQAELSSRGRFRLAVNESFVLLQRTQVNARGPEVSRDALHQRIKPQKISR